MSPDVEILLRGMNNQRGPQGDIEFLTNSWLVNYRSRGRHVAGVPSDIYFKRHHRILEYVIPRSTTLIACDPEMPSVIFGWMCGEVLDGDLTIHYAYVKDAFKARKDTGYKGLHLGTTLLTAFLDAERAAGKPALRIRHTHDTKAWQGFVKALKRNGHVPSLTEFVFDPYALYSSLPHGWATR